MQSVPIKLDPMNANVKMDTLLIPLVKTEKELSASQLLILAPRVPMTATQMPFANKILKMLVDMFANVNLVMGH